MQNSYINIINTLCNSSYSTVSLEMCSIITLLKTIVRAIGNEQAADFLLKLSFLTQKADNPARFFSDLDKVHHVIEGTAELNASLQHKEEQIEKLQKEVELQEVLRRKATYEIRKEYEGRIEAANKEVEDTLKSNSNLLSMYKEQKECYISFTQASWENNKKYESLVKYTTSLRESYKKLHDEKVLADEMLTTNIRNSSSLDLLEKQYFVTLLAHRDTIRKKLDDYKKICQEFYHREFLCRRANFSNHQIAEDELKALDMYSSHDSLVSSSKSTYSVYGGKIRSPLSEDGDSTPITYTFKSVS
ncbi:hypothetical protein QTN25_009772 [Entamoeba marina]